ncbi:MAG: PadR family transcriptional regulator [Candidatus Ranarchaeia archaeon]
MSTGLYVVKYVELSSFGAFMIWKGRGFGRGFWRHSMSPIEFLILVALQNKPSHGYELMKVLSDTFEGIWTPQSGTIYPILSRLQEREIITPLSQKEQSKKVYSVSKKGQKILKEVAKHFEKEVQFFDTVEGFVSPFVDTHRKTHHSSTKQLIHKISCHFNRIETAFPELTPSERETTLKKIQEVLKQGRKLEKQLRNTSKGSKKK